jgi:hypothetical protein
MTERIKIENDSFVTENQHLAIEEIFPELTAIMRTPLNKVLLEHYKGDQTYYSDHRGFGIHRWPLWD